jgi:quercetin dioxygenase-like cupin family protein
MHATRIFKSAEFMQPTEGEGEPIRSVITQSAEAVVVAWHVNPGQRVAAHVHPHGQDTWTVLSGSGEYQLEHNGESRTISPGHVVVAHTGCVHGVFNGGNEPLIFISVVSPAEAGYELV